MTGVQTCALPIYSAASKRLLNSVEFDVDIRDNFTASIEYELIGSSGQSSSDENLFDISAFYNIGKFDLSLRYQQKDVSGASPTDKTTMSSSLKYRLSKDAVFSLRFSYADYTDKITLANTYDSTTLESTVSMRF